MRKHVTKRYTPCHHHTRSLWVTVFVVVDCNLVSDCWYPAVIQVTNRRSSHMYLNISWCGRKRFVVIKNCGLSTLELILTWSDSWWQLKFSVFIHTSFQRHSWFQVLSIKVCFHNILNFYLKWCTVNRTQVWCHWKAMFNITTFCLRSKRLLHTDVSFCAVKIVKKHESLFVLRLCKYDKRLFGWFSSSALTCPRMILIKFNKNTTLIRLALNR